MRVWANDQMRGEKGTGPRKKWMKKRRWRADLLIRRSHSQRTLALCGGISGGAPGTKPKVVSVLFRRPGPVKP